MNGEHIWVETNASGDFCYVGETDCLVSDDINPIRELIRHSLSCPIHLYVCEEISLKQNTSNMKVIICNNVMSVIPFMAAMK